MSLGDNNAQVAGQSFAHPDTQNARGATIAGYSDSRIAFDDTASLTATDTNNVSDVYYNTQDIDPTQNAVIVAEPDHVFIDSIDGVAGAFYVLLGEHLMSGNVTVSVTSDDTTKGTVSVSSLTFDSTNDHSARRVDVTPAHNAAQGTFHIILHVSSSTNANYVGANDTVLTVYNNHSFLQRNDVVTVTGAEANGGSAGVSYTSISDDGRYTAFLSDSTNLTASPTGGEVEAYVHDNVLGTTTLASVNSLGATQDGTVQNDYIDISANGRYVLFVSSGNNLSPLAIMSQSELYVHDLVTGATALAGLSNSGSVAQNTSWPHVSGDGRFVVFSSNDSTLTANSTGPAAQNIYVRDMIARTTTLVSVNLSGISGNQDSPQGTISENGRFVAFMSQASDLVAGDTNGTIDAFIYDMELGTVSLVSHDGAGNVGNNMSGAPSVSGDGRFVTFYSAATNLLPGYSGGPFHLYVFDQQSQTLALGAVTSTGGFPVNGVSVDAYPFHGISADGQFLVFESASPDIVPSAPNGGYFVRDLWNNKTDVYSRDSLGAPINLWSTGNSLEMSGNGQFIAFDTKTGMVDDDTNSLPDSYENAAPIAGALAHLHAVPMGITVTNSQPTAVSHVTLATAPTGQVSVMVSSSDSSLGTVSPPMLNFNAGNWNVPQDVSLNFVAGGAAGVDSPFHITLHVGFTADANYAAVPDLTIAADNYASGAVQLDSISLTNGAANGDSTQALSFSDDGRYVAFSSTATNLVANDNDGFADIFVRDTLSGNTYYAGIPSPTADSLYPILASDGSLVVYTTASTGFGVMDTNNALDAVLLERGTNSTEVLSIAQNGSTTGDGAAYAVSMSGDARFVVIQSQATDMVPGDNNSNADVFVRDRLKNTTTLVSQSSAGVIGTDASIFGTISNDGRYVVFASLSTNFDSGPTGTFAAYVRDLQLGTTTRVSIDASGNPAGDLVLSVPRISGNGRYVAFAASAGYVAGDTNGVSDIFVRDTIANTTTCASVNLSGAPGNGASGGQNYFPLQLSPDGQFVVFLSDASDLVANDTNGATDVFVRDLVNGTTTLVSTDASGALANNGMEAGVAISGNDQFVAFASNAQLVATDTNTNYDVYQTTSPIATIVPHIHASPMGVSVTQSGLTAPIYVTLATKPSADVTLAVASSDVGEGTVSPATLTFTSSTWNIPQTVTLTPVKTGNSTDQYFTVQLTVASTTDVDYMAVGESDVRAINMSSYIELVSQNVNGKGANLASDGASIDSTGRYVAFASYASDLVANDNNASEDVFLRDRQLNTTTLVSLDESGQQHTSDSNQPMITPDARYVVFSSYAQLTAANNNGAGQIYRRDLQAATIVLVSADNSGNAGNAYAGNPSISDDGNVVAFASKAKNLVANDTNGLADIFIRDINAGTTIAIENAGSFGDADSLAPAIAGAGRYVAFDSKASNFVAGDVNTYDDIFVYDIQTGNIAMASLNSAGQQGNGDSSSPSISRNGRYVAFLSEASNLVPGFGVTYPGPHVYVRDLVTGTTESVDESLTGGPPSGAAPTAPRISEDGRYVAFWSSAPDLVSGDTDGGQDLFVRDLVNHTTTLVSRDQFGNLVKGQWPNGSAPAISGNDEFIAFADFAHLVPQDQNPNVDVYANIPPLSTTVTPGIETWPDYTEIDFSNAISGSIYVSLTTAPSADVVLDVLSDDASGGSSLSTSTLTFTSANWQTQQLVTVTPVSAISPTTTHVKFHVSSSMDMTYASAADSVVNVHNAATLVSIESLKNSGGLTTSGRGAYLPSLSDDGNLICFISDANDLVVGDTNGAQDVFVHDKLAGTTTLVSLASDGSHLMDEVTDAMISANGRFVVFTTADPNVVPNDTNGAHDVFLRDTVLGTTTLVSADNFGNVGNDKSVYGSVSGDGRFVVFTSGSTNLAGTDVNNAPDVFLRDTLLGTTTAVDIGVTATFGALGASNGFISENGRFVAFVSSSDDLVLGDTNNAVDIFVYDVANTTIERVTVDAAGNEANDKSHTPSLSGDGRYVVFASSATNLVSGDTNSSEDVFVFDRQTATPMLVDVASDGVSFADQGARLTGIPASTISADGQFVFFHSKSTNLVSSPAAPNGGIFVRDLVSATTSIYSLDENGVAVTPKTRAGALSGNGEFIAFDDATAYVADDTNALSDIYENSTPIQGANAHIHAWPMGVTVTATNPTAMFSVTLGKKPTADVTVDVLAGASGKYGTVSPTSLTFNASNWLTPQTVTLKYAAGGTPGADTPFPVKLTVSASMDPAYLTVSNLIIAADNYEPPALQIDTLTYGTNANTDGNSQRAALDDTGRYLAFDSTADNLVANDTNGRRDIFIRDLKTRTNTIVSKNAHNNLGDGMSIYPVVSDDISLVGFSSNSTNLDVNRSDTNGKFDAYLATPWNGNGPELLSTDMTGQNAANDQSYFTSLSGDGRFAVFESQADNIDAGDTNGHNFDVFVRDRYLNTTTLISRSTGGVVGDHDSLIGVISDDGRYVTFISTASNFDSGPAASFGNFGVFVRDLQLGTTTRVSVDTSGNPVAGAPTVPATISGDGRYIAFASTDPNIVAGDTNGALDVFVRDMQNATTTLISANTTGAVGNAQSGASGSGTAGPFIGKDGQYVLFFSDATDLVTNDVNGGPDVFIRDLVNGTTLLLSTDANGNAVSNSFVGMPAISGNDQVVVFDDNAALVTTDTNNFQDVYQVTSPPANIAPHIHASPMGIDVMKAGGAQPFYVTLATKPTADVTLSAASSDTTVAKVTPASLTFTSSNWSTPQAVYVDGLNNGVLTDQTIAINLSVTATTDPAYVARNLAVRATTVPSAVSLVSTDNNGLIGNALSQYPSIDDTGHYVAFSSVANNLIANDDNGAADVFLHNQQTGTTVGLSLNPWGHTGNGASELVVLSGDATHAAFDSTATDLVATSDNNNASDVFVVDINAQSYALASVGLSGNAANAQSYGASISRDGTKVAFSSNATDIATGVTNGSAQVFVHDMTMNISVCASVDAMGNEGNDGSTSASMSANGRYVAFDSVATNLVVGDFNNASDVFVYDTLTHSTVAVSVNPEGAVGNGSSSQPSISANGRYVAFTSSATNLVPGLACSVFVRDMVTGTTEAVDVNMFGGCADLQAWPGTAKISPDGRYVSFYSPGMGLVGGDSNLPRGHLFARDLVNRTTVIESVDASGAPIDGGNNWSGWSADDQYLAYDYAAGFLPADNNGALDVFENSRPLSTTVTPLISAWPDSVAINFTTPENGTIYVSLTTAPTADVTLDVTSDDMSGGSSLSTSSLTFTSANWSTQQPVVVTPVTGDTPPLTHVTLHVSSSADPTYATVADTVVPVHNEFTFLTLASLSSTGTVGLMPGSAHGNGYSVSSDDSGHIFAFASDLQGLDPSHANNNLNVFVRDDIAHTTKLISIGWDGSASNDISTGLQISADGRFVAFASPASNLIQNDTNGTWDIFVADIAHSTVSRVSVANGGGESNNYSVNPSISGDGRFVTFRSGATNLGPADNNGSEDIYLHDMLTGENTLVSANASGGAGNSASVEANISENGRFVVFSSNASDLVSGDSNGTQDIFLYDVLSGSMTLVSADGAGNSANGRSGEASISGDGRYVVYQTDSNTPVAGAPNDGVSHVFLFDSQSGTTTNVAYASDGVSYPSGGALEWTIGYGVGGAISADGQFVIFASHSTDIVASPATPNGATYVRDLVNATTTLLSVDQNGAAPSTFDLDTTAMSGNGQFAFMTDGLPYVPADTNGSYDVYRNSVPLKNAAPHVHAVPMGVTVSKTSPSATYHLTLATKPTGDVTVTPVSSDATLGTTSPATLTFTSANWNVAQDVTLTFVDGAGGGDSAFQVKLTTTSADANYNSLAMFLAADNVRPAAILIDSVSLSGSAANQASQDVSLSDTGRYVAFDSSATNLVANDTNLENDVFVRDLQSNTNTLVSVRSDGIQGNGASALPAISSNGRVIAFTTNATNLSSVADTNGQYDAYVNNLDNALGPVLVSVDVAGTTIANGVSVATSVSGDGRYVVFSSSASNVAAADTNPRFDVFVRDVWLATTTLVSQSTGGVAGNDKSFFGSISNDGRYVAFISEATNFDAGGPIPGAFIRDLQLGTTTRVSFDKDGNPASVNHENIPLVSGDGRYVAYVSSGANVVAGDTNGVADVFVYDTVNHTNTCASVNLSGTPGNGANGGPSKLREIDLSLDGQFVTFASSASDLVAGDTNNSDDVFVRDLVNGTTTLISTDSKGHLATNVIGAAPAISGNDQWVAFDDGAKLVNTDTNAALDIYQNASPITGIVPHIHGAPMGIDVLQGAGAEPLSIALATAPTADVRLSIVPLDPAVATLSTRTLTFTTANWSTPQVVYVDAVASGALVDQYFTITVTVAATTDAQYAVAPNLVVRGTASPSAMLLASTDSNGIIGNDAARRATVDDSGRYVVFESLASNLVPLDNNGHYDVFLRDQQTGTTTCVSMGLGGNTGNGDSVQAVISGDGAYVAFGSIASDLVASDGNGTFDVFLYNVATKVVSLISTDSSGVQANGYAFEPSISRDGRYVAFQSNASNLNPAGGGGIFVHDNVSGATVGAGEDNMGAAGNALSDQPAIAANGRYVVFESDATNFVAGDVNGARDVFRYDLQTTTIAPVSLDDEGNLGNARSYGATVSANGRYVAFISEATNLVPGQICGGGIYVHDMVTGTTELVDATASGGCANGFPIFASISADGRDVVFATAANNVVAGETQRQDVFVRDLVNRTTWIVSRDAAGQELGTNTLDWARISANDEFVVFDTHSSNVPADINGKGDVYENAQAFSTTVTPLISAWPDRVGVDFTKSLNGEIYVSLTTAPSADVVISATTDDTGGGTTLSTSTLTFTSANWNTQQLITVTPVDTSSPTTTHVTLHVASTTDPTYSSVADTLVSVQNEALFLKRVSVTTAPVEGDGPSYTPSLSDDGRYVVFLTGADNLVSGDMNMSYDVLMQDNVTGAITQIDLSSGGSENSGNCQANMSMSADARYVAFACLSSNLAPGVSAFNTQIFVRDTQNSTTTLISADGAGSQGNGDSGNASISGDGRFVAFDSMSGTFSPLDMNGTGDVYVRDTVLGTLTLVSANGAGHAANAQSNAPAISENGRFIAYASDATDLTTDTNGARDVFVYDMLAGTTTLVSVDSSGVQGNGYSSYPAISGDGRYIVYLSNASNLSADDTNGASADIFVFDQLGLTTTLVSYAAAGGSGNGNCSANANAYAASISADGQFVVFASSSTDLVTVSAPSGGLFIRDLAHGTTTIASLGEHRIPASPFAAIGQAISGDGHVAAFADSQPYVANDFNGQTDVYETASPIPGSVYGIHAYPMGITVTDTSPTAITYVSLLKKPASNVTLAVSSSDTTLGTVSPSTLTFTSANWNVPQAVTLTIGPAGGGDTPFQINFHPTGDANYSILGNYFHVVADNVRPPAIMLDSVIGAHAANAASANPSLNDDGTVVAFDSAATNLVPGDTNAHSDVFVRNNTTHSTTRVSLNSSSVQGNGASFSPMLSASGQFVAFTSDASNFYGDINAATDAFVVDLVNGGGAQLVSVNSAGVAGDAASIADAINGDGRFVVFESHATNFANSDTNNVLDVFVRDTVKQVTTLVSQSTGGAIGNAQSKKAAISNDGVFVAFKSDATNLVAFDTNSAADVFLRDLSNGTTTRVSVASGGTEANATSSWPSLSGDGRYVAFNSDATNIIPGDTNAATDVFIRDTVVPNTICVSLNPSGHVGNGSSGAPMISTDGQFVAFYSFASDLVPGDTNGTADIFVRDLLNGTTTLYSTDVGGLNIANSPARLAISGNGKIVAFDNGTDLIASDTNGVSDIYQSVTPIVGAPRIHVDRMGVTVIEGGAMAPMAVTLSTQPTSDVTISLTPSDLMIADVLPPVPLTFTSTNWSTPQIVNPIAAPNSAPTGDVNFTVVLHVSSTSDPDYSVVGDTTVRVTDLELIQQIESNKSNDTSANDESYYASLSGDGRYVAFQSNASDMVPNDLNGAVDVFLRDRQTGITSIVSANSMGSSGAGASSQPSISTDGNVIAYSSTATDITATNSSAQIFVYNRTALTTTVASVDGSGILGNNTSLWPSVNSDGTLVAFSSTSSNLTASGSNGNYQCYVHDMFHATTTIVSVDNGGAMGNGSCYLSKIAANGRYVAFDSDASNLVAGDVNGGRDVFVYDLLTQSIAIASVDNVGNISDGTTSNDASISADGRYVAFTSNATNLAPYFSSPSSGGHVYVHDMVLGTTTLVDEALAGGASNSANIGLSSISPNGRFVSFWSDANNLVANDTDGGPDLFIRDLVNGTTILESVNGQGQQVYNAPFAGSWSSFSSDGSYIAFNDGTALVPNDTVSYYDIYENTNPMPTIIEPRIFATPEYSEIDFENGTSATISVQLNTPPTANVVMSVTNGDPSNSSLSTSTLTFTPGDWSTPQTVTVTPTSRWSPQLFAVTFHVTSTTDMVYASWVSDTVVHVYNMTPALLSRESLAPGNVELNSFGYGGSTSDDGRYVVFASMASNLPNPGGVALYRRDTWSGAVVRIDVNDAGAITNGWSGNPVISGDGRYVVFRSQATNFDPAASNGSYALIFVRDTQASTTRLVTKSVDGVAGNGTTQDPSISSDGRYIVYYTTSTNISPASSVPSIWLFDQVLGTTSLVSHLSAGGPASGVDAVAMVSANGRYVAWSSGASGIDPSDHSNQDDVFIYDVLTATNQRVSVALGGGDPNSGSTRPSISSDGRYVLFTSSASNLVANDTNGSTSDIFVYDTLLGSTTLVSEAVGGTSGNAASTLYQLSAQLSGNGQFALFYSSATDLVSPSTTSQALFVRDIVNHSTSVYSFLPNGTLDSSFPQIPNGYYGAAISGNGRYFTFSDTAAFATDDTNSQTDVYRNTEALAHQDPRVNISPMAVTLTEAAPQQTVNVVLATQPMSNVTVDFTTNATYATISGASTLTFTSSNWNVPQTVTFDRVAATTGDHAFDIRASTTTSADPIYSTRSDTLVAANNIQFTEFATQTGLTPSSGTGFGDSVAISDDGNTLAGWVSNSGIIFIKVRNAGVWTEQTFINRSGNVALSGDGNTLAIGAFTDDNCNTGVGASYSGGCSSAGAVYVYTRSGTTWSFSTYIKPSDVTSSQEFGLGIAISKDGTTIVAGAPGERSLSSGINSVPDSSGTQVGAAYVYRLSGGSWTEQAYLKAAAPENSAWFGFDVSASEDGNVVAVGAFGESSSTRGINTAPVLTGNTNYGAAYLFRFAGGVWSQEAYLKASNAGSFQFFASSVRVSADGNTLICGAAGDSSNASTINGNEFDTSQAWAGAAFVYRYTGSFWFEQAYLKPGNDASDTHFGYRVAISNDGNRVVVSEPYDNSGASGVNGDEFDTSASQTGSAFVYDYHGAWSQRAYLKSSAPQSSGRFGYNGLVISGDGHTVGASESAASGIVYVFTDN